MTPPNKELHKLKEHVCLHLLSICCCLWIKSLANLQQLAIHMVIRLV